MFSRWLWYFAAALVGVGLAAAAVLGLAAALVYPTLPSLEALTDYRPKVPLRIYTEDGVLLGEFGEERRAVVRLADTPLILRQAILAAEDERFYKHGGVDTLGVLRAALSNIVSGGVREGASTITMQVARNFFLTSERTFRRKLNEALLAIKIEHALSKDEILELYINHIYLGQRAYGFAAAAQIYYGKPLKNLSLAEAAMLAGLPKAPSAYNPVVNPARAQLRQRYVLGRMLELGYISPDEYERALKERLRVRHSPQGFEVPADHVAEMVRQYMHQRYGDAIYVSGMRVYTTIRRDEQLAAAEAVLAGLTAFNRRRGYAGPEAQWDLPAEAKAAEALLDERLPELQEVGGMLPAVVLAVERKRILARLANGEEIELGAAELKFAQNFLSNELPPGKRLRRGSVIRVVRLDGKTWQLTYLPKVQAALVALSPQDGAIRALVGGFDFSQNQFNRITQAWRQPGSSFKPFIYSAALERGLTPASVVEDAPLQLDPFETGGVPWEPKNFDGVMDGPITLRDALRKSKNLATLRVLQAVGIDAARQHVARFGFDMTRIPPYLTMALGAGEVTPLAMAAAYSAFANGGNLVRPWLIRRITDQHGRVLEAFQPPAVQRILDPRNAFIMTTLLQDVVRRGTATAALRLRRSDLAGKTGTTNDHRDAWFAGYNPYRVAVAWVGYDQPRPMGGTETGSVAALPIWMGYMARALRDVPDQAYPMPTGVIVRRIDPASGRLVAEGADGMAEYFYEEFAPAEPAASAGPAEEAPALEPAPSPTAPPVRNYGD
ncbi:MAG: penicillin-binding protein 1A [Thiobacillaceae bacterium]|nr:penicillin-binding protein 1A [Thiobacillaceae bacterium]